MISFCLRVLHRNISCKNRKRTVKLINWVDQLETRKLNYIETNEQTHLRRIKKKMKRTELLFMGQLIL